MPYLDLNGELDVFRAMKTLSVDWQPAIGPSGAGFGVVAGESAAMHAVSMLGNRRVWLGLMPDLGTFRRCRVNAELWHRVVR